MGETYLEHHGIKGMKWGVRRYQNYDGSYTQKGLERYRKAEAKYDDASARLKKAQESGDTAGMSKARSDRGLAKAEMEKQYRQLKYDKRADKGKELYKQGKTITEISAKNRVFELLGSAGGYALYKAYQSYGKEGMSSTTKTLAAIGGLAVTASAVAGVNAERKKSYVRAYYGH